MIIKKALKYFPLLFLTVSFNFLSLTVNGQDTESDLKIQLEEAKAKNNEQLTISTYIQLGDLYVKEGKVNKGQRFYRRGERRNNDNQYPTLAFLIHRQYARSYIQQKKFDEALTSYNEALSVAKKNKLKQRGKKIEQEINRFKKQLEKRNKAKEELETLNSMSREEAIKRINEENRKDSIETEAFFKQIESLTLEDGLNKAKLRRYQDELSKKELRIELLDQYSKTKAAENDRNKAYLVLKNNEIKRKELESQRQQGIIVFFIIVSVLMVSGILIVVFYYRRQRKLNTLLSEKNALIKEKNAEMISSLNYAQRIQNAVLVGNRKIDSYFPNYFILNQPKDIVSGDFFWINKTKDNKTAWAVVDCTGHGVPGAFMSIIGNQMLNEIILEKNITDPGEVLNEMRNGIVHSLNHKSNQETTNDGMDMALCVWNPKTNILEYAGANNNIYIYREHLDQTSLSSNNLRLRVFENQLIELKANRMPVGLSHHLTGAFDTVRIQLEKGDIIYATSDGFQDQFGGPKNKKYSTKRLKRLMIEVNEKPIHEFDTIFRNELIKWKGETEQLDDICVVGVRV